MRSPKRRGDAPSSRHPTRNPEPRTRNPFRYAPTARVCGPSSAVAVSETHPAEPARKTASIVKDQQGPAKSKPEGSKPEALKPEKTETAMAEPKAGFDMEPTFIRSTVMLTFVHSGK